MFFYLKDVHPWENNAHLLSLSKKEFSDFEINVMARKIKNNYKGFDQILPGVIQTTCMTTSSGKIELIDINGDIFNCNEFPFVDRLSDYNVGNVYNNTTREDTYGIEDWYSKIENNYNGKCLNCNLFPMYGGHCPKHWVDGKYNACPRIIYNIENRLILQYLTM